jgi:hypothetical protein
MKTPSLALFWWDSVTGPVRLVNEVADRLSMPSNVVLALPDDVPWRRNMRDAIIEALKARPGVQDLTVTDLDGTGVTSPPDSLRELALTHIRDGYMSWACDATDYLRDNGILSNRLVWVRNVSRENMSIWEDFCRRWVPSKPSQGLILIEADEDYQGRIPTVRYSSFVSENSVRTLCSTLLEEESHVSLTEERRRYSSVLIARLSLGDAEFAEAFADVYRPLSDDPIDAMKKLAIDGDYSDRRSLSDCYPLSLIRRREYDILQTRLWESQVECIFPIIERDRLEIAEMHQKRLGEIANSGILDTEYAQYRSYRDIEIGQIYWLANTHRLHIEDVGEKEHISLLRDCRNIIAHRKCIDEARLRLLIDRQGWRPPNRRYSM